MILKISSYNEISMVRFQALTWDARDDDDSGAHLISIFGKTLEGKSVCVTTEFTPYFFVKILVVLFFQELDRL